jgi:peptidoglycan hydrolase-like protein with peptidoglycan-binding domain
MTSAKQGPWTDIYGLSATLYHAITGAAPPSAFDRMLEDTYEPLGRLMPAGLPPGLLIGIDAGLAIRATDRPQTIAGWRPLLSQAGASDAAATVALNRPAPTKPSVSTARSEPPAKRGIGLWLGIVAGVLLLAGGGYYFATKPSTPTVVADPDRKAAEQKAAEQRAEQERQELVRLRADAAAREKADQEAALRRQVEEETRKIVEAEAAARRKAEEDERRAAEAAETGLRLLPADRQRVQTALSSLGFNAGGVDGVFNQRTREMIASWQREKNYPATGFLTGIQHQALLREAAPALAKYDEDQRKLEEARVKPIQAPPPSAAAPPSQQQAAVAPPPTPSGPVTGTDGLWRGTYHCTASRHGGDFTMHVQLTVAGGTGTWTRPGSGPNTAGNQSLTVKIAGSQVYVSRVYSPLNQVGVFTTGTMLARFENGTITGTGPEQNSGGRTCTINLTR